MLIKMARWLRIMGIDVIVPQVEDDDQIFEIARSTGRILLTRDKELSLRRGIKAERIISDTLKAQLRQFLLAFEGIEGMMHGSRCPLCNGVLNVVSIDDLDTEMAHRIPERVLDHNSRFYVCQCGKIYWEGTHWSRINVFLSEIGVTPELPSH